MRKLFASFTLFLSTLFITSNLNASSFNLKNDNNYLTSNLLISYGGGGGGGGGKNSAKGRAKEKAKLLFKKRQAAKKVSEGLPLTEEEKKILYFDEIAD
tara:strand:- start:294 stop:590 length:297 start_codon:yes stop_codon:yes gene_type:complete